MLRDYFLQVAPEEVPDIEWTFNPPPFSPTLPTPKRVNNFCRLFEVANILQSFLSCHNFSTRIKQIKFAVKVKH